MRKYRYLLKIILALYVHCFVHGNSTATPRGFAVCNGPNDTNFSQMIAVAGHETRQPHLRVLSPKHHFLTQSKKLHFEVETFAFRVPEDGYIHFYGEKLNYVHNSTSKTVIMSPEDPGTIIVSVALVDRYTHQYVGSVVRVHIEQSIPSDVLVSGRYYLSSIEKSPSVFVNLKQHSELSTMKICILTNTEPFDGQKQIWLQQVKHLSTKSKFQFELISFSDTQESGLFINELRKLGIKLNHIPLVVRHDDVVQHGINENNVLNIMLDIYKRNYSHIPPEQWFPSSWVTNVMDTIVTAMKSCYPQVLVFANSRSVGDEVITLAARIAAVPTVIMELPNHYPEKLDVDAVIAPSNFVLTHPSVHSNVKSDHRYVINPGIDTSVFRPRSTNNLNNESEEGLVVGYVGRLNPEKSVGMLLRAMGIVQRAHPSIKVLIVGNGPLENDLRKMAVDKEWGALNDSSIQFITGQYKRMEQYLQRMDIFVTPSLGEEQFCIANIEAMSVGLPIVSFGSGGTLEYLDHGTNSYIVDDASPQGLAEGIQTLVEDAELRNWLGSNGRKTVERKFRLEFMLEKYEKLYDRFRPLSHS